MMSTPATMTRAHRSLVSHGTNTARAAAASRNTTAADIPQRLSRLIALSPPPMGVERAQGQEKREPDHRHVVHDVLDRVHAFPGPALARLPSGAGIRSDGHTAELPPPMDIVFRLL